MVQVNSSVSSQGNATWETLATTNTRRRYQLLHEEEMKIFAKNMFSVREREGMSSQGFLHILNSKVIQQYHTAMAQLTVTIYVSCVTPYLCITLKTNNCHRTVLFHSRCHNIFCFATQNTKTFQNINSSSWTTNFRTGRKIY